MSNHFEVTLNQFTFSEKPTPDQTRQQIRPAKHNSIAILTVRQLAKAINQGHAFHAGVLDYEQNTELASWDPNQASPYLNSTCFVPSRTRLLSIDVDHGNMTLKELKDCMKGIPYAMIYKTKSYTEATKKYRVLFLANRCFKSVEEFQLVQSSFIYLFAHPFRERMKEMIEAKDKVDFSPKDPARISYAGEVIETHDRTFDLNAFLQMCEEMKMAELKASFLAEWKALKTSLSKGAKGKRENALPRPKGRSRKVCNTTLREDVLDLITDGLQAYGLDHRDKLKTLRLEFLNTIDFINEIPLTELLGEDLLTLFCCYLPLHDDQTPSANLILDDEGRTRYFCFGCCEEDHEGHSLSTFDFIETVFTFYNPQLSRYRIIETIFSFLDLRVYSDYQNEVSFMLRENRRFLHEWEHQDPLHRALSRGNHLGLWRELIEMAEFKCPYKPLTFNREGDYACFFASNRYITEFMQSRGYIGFSDVKATNKKINKLVKLGLIEKISDRELDPDFLEESLNYRELLQQQEFLQNGVFKRARRMDFYIVPVISAQMLEQAEEVLGFDKKHRVLAKHQSMKQTLIAHGKEVSQSVFVQSKNELSKKDENFLKHLNAAVDRLLEKKGWFTVKQLCAAVDPKGNLIKAKHEVDQYGVVKTTSAKAIRERKVETFLPGVKIKKGLTASTIRKDLREKYNVPRSVTRGMKIYYKEDSEESVR